MPRIVPADSRGRYAIMDETDGRVLVYGSLEVQHVPADAGTNSVRLGDISFVTEPIPQADDSLERQVLDAQT